MIATTWRSFFFYWVESKISKEEENKDCSHDTKKKAPESEMSASSSSQDSTIDDDPSTTSSAPTMTFSAPGSHSRSANATNNSAITITILRPTQPANKIRITERPTATGKAAVAQTGKNSTAAPSTNYNGS